MSNNSQEIQKRRIFGIISHPDAGKTTLTEKLLLHGGAIREAGTVKARGKNKFAKSDWMEIEKQRGISVTSSVMQFEYDGKVVSIMDTPGHNDFGEDTYRILTSVDSAVMVIDAAKGVEAQTVKLFKVCSMREIPIFTFINKLDRQSKDPLDCMADLEDALGLPSTAVTWPIGNGLTFEGIYDRLENKVYLYKQKNGVIELGANGVYGDALEGVISDANLDILRGEMELLDGAGNPFDLQAIKEGKITFFVAKRGYRSVGMCSVAKCYSTFACSDTGIYDDFYIEPAFRGKGIARKLANAAQTWCKENGISSLTVCCAPCDEKMYQALGFEICLGTTFAHIE